MNDPKQARCFDPDWRYTPSGSTDIRKTFERFKRQQKDQQRLAATNVKPLKRGKS